MAYAGWMDSDIIVLPSETRLQRLRARATRHVATTFVLPNPLTMQPLPRWIGHLRAPEPKSGQGVSGQTMSGLEPAFAAGAAVFALDQMIRAAPPWLGCLVLRQALRSASVAARLLRLNADEAALRDALHLTRPGDDPGPAGRLHALLRQLTLRPTRLAEATLEVIASEIEGAAASAEVLALLRADIALAQRLEWERPLPLHLTLILDPALRKGVSGQRPNATGADWTQHRHPVLGRAAVAVYGQAVDLARRAEALSVAASTLRTRDGGGGLSLILADDSVAPWRMAQLQAGLGRRVGETSSGQQGLGSDRAARRLCESLHALGSLRLLTDRPTFRLYGL